MHGVSSSSSRNRSPRPPPALHAGTIFSTVVGIGLSRGRCSIGLQPCLPCIKSATYTYSYM